MVTIICDTSILCRKQQTHKVFRNYITTWLKETYLNKFFVNSQTGIEVYINKTGIEKIVSSFGDIKAHAFTAIPSIIENANFIEAQNDNRNRPDYKTFIFKTVVVVDKDAYELWIYIRQIKNQNFLYSLNIAAQKKLQS